MENTRMEVELKNDGSELNCMSCLSQIMDNFANDLSLEEINRVSIWFENKYNYSNMYDKKQDKGEKAYV